MKLLFLIILAVICFGCFLYGSTLFVINDFTIKAGNPSLLFVISTFLAGIAVINGIIRIKKERE